MELGEKLKEARMEQGLSLDDVQKDTKIQKRYLEALERNDWSTMPGSFYVRAFVREYADVLGLNGDDLLEEHASELPSTPNEQYEFSPPPRSNRASRNSSNVFKFLPKLLVVVLVVAVAFLIYYAVINYLIEPDSDNQDSQVGDNQVIQSPNETEEPSEPSQDENPNEDDTVDEEPVEEEPQPALQVASTDENRPLTVYELTEADQINLVIDATGNCWTGITGINGNEEQSYYSDSITPNKSPLEFTIEENQVLLNLGASQNVSIQVNGVPLEYELEPVPNTGKYVHQYVLIELSEE